MTDETTDWKSLLIIAAVVGFAWWYFKRGTISKTNTQPTTPLNPTSEYGALTTPLPAAQTVADDGYTLL